MDWIYQGKPIAEAPSSFGFIYLITQISTQKKYIGRKNLKCVRTKKKKGRRNQKVTKESDWKNYWSSSDAVKNLVRKFGEDDFRREILFFCATKGELTYGEVREQISRDVLCVRMKNGEREYLNGNIMSRWFAKTEKAEQP